MKRLLTVCLLLCCCATLTGCGDSLLRRSYASSTPHSAAYWENEDADTLRADNYQDLVNALLLLLEEHSEGGVVRMYGDAVNKALLTSDACIEVQKKTPIGTYLLDYITYDGRAESSYYELEVHFGYRRTAEDQKAIINATSTEALPDLLRAAIREGRGSVAIRFGYFTTDREGVMALIRAVHDELYPPPAPPAPEEPPVEGGEPEEGGEPAEGGESAETMAATDPDAPDDTQAAGAATEGEAEPAEGEGAEPAETEEPADLSPWTVIFYPDDRPAIVEVILQDESSGAHS